MKPVVSQISAVFTAAIKRAVEGVVSVAPEAAIVPANPKFGDYQCNNAMQLFKTSGEALNCKNPKDLADKIVSNLGESRDLFTSIIVAPQGFITVKLNHGWISEKVDQVLLQGFSYTDPNPKRVVVDFSSPNIAKEMHVGHLRSTIIGESTSRILESAGHQVTRLNHVGDWGTQFGMLIEFMKETYPDFLTNLPEISDLQNFYKASKRRFDEDADFKKKAQLQVVALQSGDEFARHAWQCICQISRNAFQEIYDRLSITLTERGESFYNAMIPPIVEQLEKEGLVVDSKGAKCIFTSVDEVPLMVVKSDGGFGYDSTDMAAIHHRLVTMQANWLIYITDLGQENHFFKIFDAAKQAGWHTPTSTRVDHVGFGVVQGEDGKKFKTRSGETVKLSALLDEAEERAKAELTVRLGVEGGTNLTEDEIENAARVIGNSAVKYFDLRQNRVTNYIFNYDRMLDPKGNTAVYLLYAYARICSILRKSGVPIADLVGSGAKLVLAHEKERALGLEILRFPDIIASILGDLYAHRLPEYMWELSNKFTSFYVDCKVIGSEEQSSRLLLCEVTRKALEKCFFLLGIVPLEKM